MHPRLQVKYALIATMVLSLPMSAYAASRPDAWITMKAKTALCLARDVKGTAINVDTINGRVTLYGDVSDENEKIRAGDVVGKVEGVNDVRNMLHVVPPTKDATPAKRTDDQIKLDVQKRLNGASSLHDSSIIVKSVDHGVVLLAGKAASLDDGQRALYYSATQPGVVRVTSEIDVTDTLSDDDFRTEAGVRMDADKHNIGDRTSDLWIVSATKMKLAADSRTPATDVNVDSRDGMVTLFGIVPTQESKSAATEIAKSVSGVKNVQNEIEIVSSANHDLVQARDEEIQENVKKSLKDRGDQANADIDVQVENGVVRLTGTVPTWQRNLSAVYAARSVAGVRSIRNEMKVVTPSAAKS